MKRKISLLKYVLVCLGLLGSVFIVGCQQEKLYDSNAEKLPPSNDYFDFGTTEQLSLEVKYNIPEYKVLFALYTEDPMEVVDGVRKLKEGVSPSFQAYTDDDCNYTGVVTLPNAVKSVYLYSNYLFVPQCIEINVEQNQIYFSTEEATITRSYTPSNKPSFVKNGESAYLVSGSLYSLTHWNDHGGFSDLGESAHSYCKTVHSVTPSQSIGKLFARLQSKLGGIIDDENKKQDNSNLLSSEEFTNISISSKTAAGTTVEGAQIDLVFLNERAGYRNTLGYYYYRTEDLAKGLDVKQLPQYIILPNVSQKNDNPYDKFSNRNLPPMRKGMKFQLKYFGEDGRGVAQDQFPAGYTIGWFIISDAYTDKNTINSKNTYQYSNVSANKDGKARCITVFDKITQKMVVGFEDGSDNSFEDILFYVEADPIEAIVDPEKPGVPSIDEEDKPIVMPDKTNTTVGTLAFEDIWPSGGDYDLNDVIVEYKVAVTFDKDNRIKKVVETFTPVHDGAIFKNAFGFQVPEVFGASSLAFSEGVKEESGQARPTYIVFSNAKAETVAQNSFTITRDANESPIVYTSTDAATIMAAYNPFILPKYEEGDQSRIEVHLPKYPATSFADLSLVGSADDAYYLNKTGAYPFAIHLPIVGFKPVTEKSSIDQSDEYPEFRKWADSFGKEAQEWYKNFQRK